MERLKNAIRLFSTDLDGTILGEIGATRRFRVFWNSIGSESRPLLVYNSGRFAGDIFSLIDDRVLDPPDYVIGGVGTEIFAGGSRSSLAAFEHSLQAGWDLARVEEIAASIPGICRQPARYLSPCKSSWYLQRATRECLRRLRARLLGAGLKVQLIYSSRRDLDIIPACANKGNALAWLCRRLGFSLSEVLVAGDTGNDAAMFRLPGVRAIAVGNSERSLLNAADGAFRSSGVSADGVIEGMRHFGICARERCVAGASTVPCSMSV